MFKPKMLAVAVVAGVTLSSGAFAQDTSSSVRGKVLSDSGQVVSDAKVTLVHISTGRKVEAKVNAEGVYTFRGVRVGGPYILSVDSDSHSDDVINDVYLAQGANTKYNFNLTSVRSSAAIEEVVVTGTRINQQRGSDFSADDISKTSSIARDIYDTVKRNPLAVKDGSQLVIAGTNPKLNSFVVDGVRQNDNFGLNSSGYPTQRSPISLDAIETVSLKVSPFSVTQGGFSGGIINVTTKSGTNDVEGTVFYEFTDPDFAGDEVDGVDIGDAAPEEKTWGATVGFPIVKDKLFGFLSYEQFDKPVTPLWGPVGSGSISESRVTQADWDRIENIAQSVYGLSTIGGFSANPVEEDKKVIAKLDWQINDDHRLSTTYQDTLGNRTRNMSSRSSTLNASSYWYNIEEGLETFRVILNSDWNDNLSTEVKAGYKDTITKQLPFQDLGIGQVSVRTDDGTVNLGVDQYRQANRLNNQTSEFLAKGSYLMGDHEIVFGYNYNNTDVFNMFVPGAKGVWRFDSIDDFENGVVDGFSYANAASGNAEDAAASFSMKTHTLFVEDNWIVNDELDVNYGLRYEYVSMPDAPEVNQNFVDRYGFENSGTFDGEAMFMPRVGFKYSASENIELSGGIGKFSGGYPLVWMSNSYSNDGQGMLTYPGDWDPTWNLDFGSVPQDATDALVGGDGYVNSLDPNFELPYDWRFKLRAESYWSIPLLSDEVEITAEVMHKQRKNDVSWTDLSRREVGVDGTGRVVYETYDPLTGMETDRYDLMLTNADKDGDSTNLTLSLSNDWDNGFSVFTSYTYSDVNEGNLGGSSTAKSNFQYPVVQYDRNGSTLGRGAYSNEHRFTLAVDWEKQLFSGYDTRVNMFYEARSGRPLDWVLGSHNDGNLGDQRDLNRSDAYLPYIPTGADDPNVEYGWGLDYDTFMAAVNEIGLGKYAGQIIPKGVDTQPSFQSLDLNITQEVPGFSKDHKGVISLSFVNVLNMLNDEWGVVKVQSFGSKILVDHNYDEATGVYTYSVPFGQSELETENHNSILLDRSVWQLKLGLRYKF